MSEVALQEVPVSLIKPIKHKKLTLKERGFVNDVVRTKNLTEAVARNYKVKDRSVAKTIGSENMAKPHIRSAVDTLLQKAGYNPTSSINALIQVESDERAKVTGADRINASKFLLELAGVYKKHNTSVNYNFDVISQDQAYSFNESYGKVLTKRKRKGQTPRNQNIVGG